MSYNLSRRLYCRLSRVVWWIIMRWLMTVATPWSLNTSYSKVRKKNEGRWVPSIRCSKILANGQYTRQHHSWRSLGTSSLILSFSTKDVPDSDGWLSTFNEKVDSILSLWWGRFEGWSGAEQTGYTQHLVLQKRIYYDSRLSLRSQCKRRWSIGTHQNIMKILSYWSSTKIGGRTLPRYTRLSTRPRKFGRLMDKVNMNHTEFGPWWY